MHCWRRQTEDQDSAGAETGALGTQAELRVQQGACQVQVPFETGPLGARHRAWRSPCSAENAPRCTSTCRSPRVSSCGSCSCTDCVPVPAGCCRSGGPQVLLAAAPSPSPASAAAGPGWSRVMQQPQQVCSHPVPCCCAPPSGPGAPPAPASGARQEHSAQRPSGSAR